MNKPKRSLRSTLAELAATFADAVLDAARESILELDSSRTRATPTRERPVAARAPAPTRRRQAKPARVALEVEPTAASMTSDLLITDPQALLTALDTASPNWARDEADAMDEKEEKGRAAREEPEILRPASAVVPVATFAPALREGEVIVRRSAAGVVFRRRRA